MQGIDKDFYCSAGYEFTDIEDGNICPMMLHLELEDRDCRNCGCYHRKHPTPEEYKEEYGEEYPDNAAVYLNGFYPDGEAFYYSFHAMTYLEARIIKTKKKRVSKWAIVCACTPFGKPPDSWRPK